MDRSIKKALLGLVLCLFAVCASAVEVADVQVEEHSNLGDASLTLNGTGVRSKFFVKVYVAALYVTEPTSDAAAVINATAPRRVWMHLLREVSADTLLESLREGMQHNNAPAAWASFAKPMARMTVLFHKVGRVKPGDEITMDFGADGVAIAMNDQSLGIIDGEAFGRGLLRVWLGEHPVDAALKEALLTGR